MKKFNKLLSLSALFLSSVLLFSCATNKGEITEIDSESFSPKIFLIASDTQRLVKFDTPQQELYDSLDAKSVKAASMKISIFSGRKPSQSQDSEPVVTFTVDLAKNIDTLLNGYDIMANEKDLKKSAEQIDSLLSQNQYYYAKGEFEITVKDDKTVTKTKTLYSNDTVYTPLSK